MSEMKIKFEVPGEPVGQARPRIVRSKYGKVHGIDPAKSKNYKVWVKYCAIQEIKKNLNGKYKLLEQPVKIRLKIYRSIQKTGSQKSKALKEAGQILPTVKPDIDNVFKAVTDALTQIVWQDDKQIVDVEMSKRYSNEPRVEVEIEEIKSE